jgi:hypothetical protein
VVPTPANVEIAEGEDGTHIQIRTETGDTVRFTSGSDSFVSYLGPVDGTPYHLVEQSFMDGAPTTVIVDERSGSRTAMVGIAVPSPSGRRLASAGGDLVDGASWVELVELTDEGPIRRVVLDLIHLGLWAEGSSEDVVTWSKTDALTLDVSRLQTAPCDAADPELALTPNQDGTWDVWLDAGRSIAVVDSLTTRVVGEHDHTVQGRFVGFLSHEAFGDPVPVFDPAWTYINVGTPPATPPSLLLDLDAGPLLLEGWPQFSPEGSHFITTEAPCPATQGPMHRSGLPMDVFKRTDSGWTSVARFHPMEMGWSASSAEWTADDLIELPGWVPGALVRRGDSEWVATHTGVFTRQYPSAGPLEAFLVDAVDTLPVGLPGARPVVTLPLPGGETGPYRYLGYSEELKAHLVRAGAGDSGVFLLIGHRTGGIWTVPDVPIPSESGGRFATVRRQEDQRYDVAIYEWNAESGPVQLWQGGVAEVEDARWDTDRYLSLGPRDAVQLNRHTDGEERWSRGVG